MDIKEEVAMVEASPEFAAFREENANVYLAHAFSMHGKDEPCGCQIGYYAPGKDKLIVFDTAPVKRLPEDDAFNKDGTIKRLDLQKVKLSCEEAEEKALAFQRQEFPNENVTKVIMILQNLDAQLYNFTLVTDHFNILNVRVDAGSGEVLSHDIKSILSLRKSDEERKK